MSFSFLRFGQFCDFRPNTCFSASGSKCFEILPFSFISLTLSISFVKLGVFPSFCQLKGNSIFFTSCKKTEFP
ncbi:hypothetical protein Hanom_Chr16g01515071 [Helianthus anomalus]